MSFFSYCKTWFERAMIEPDINSRLVFLFHGLAVAFGLVFLTIAFVFSPNKDNYPMMIGTLGGSVAAGAAGRWLTKKNGADDK
jgi:hypothetical protein